MTSNIHIIGLNAPSRYIEIFDQGQEILIIDTDGLRGGLYFWMISRSFDHYFDHNEKHDLDGHGRLKIIGVDFV